MQFGIYIINLDRNPERLAAIASKLEAMRLRAFRIPGIDGQGLSKAALADFRHARPAEKEWTPGAIGCFLSHEHAWRRIAEADYDFGVVFEDDMNLSPQLATSLHEMGPAVMWADLVRLEGTSHRMRLGRHGGFRFGAFTFGEVESESWCAGGYALSKATAARLLAEPASRHIVVDKFLFHKGESQLARQLRILQMIPAACVQTKYDPEALTVFKSEIEHESALERLMLTPWWKAKGFFNILRGYRRVPLAADIAR